MAIDLRSGPYVSFSRIRPLSAAPGINLSPSAQGAGGDAPPPGWSPVTGDNGQTYWRNDITGDWYDPVGHMQMDAVSGQWAPAAQPVNGPGNPSGTAPSGGGTGQPAPSAGGPQTGPKNGDVRHVPVPDLPGYVIQETYYNGQWIVMPGTNPFRPTAPAGTAPRQDSPAQTATAAAATANAATAAQNAQTSAFNAQTAASKAAADAAADIARLAQSGDIAAAQVALQKAIALGVIDGQETLASIQLKAQLKEMADRLGLDTSKFEWQKKLDEAQLTGLFNGQTTLQGKVAANQIAQVMGYDEAGKPTLATQLALGRVNGQSTLERDLGEANSRRSDMLANLQRQGQAYNQYASDRQFTLDLARQPESEIAYAFMAGGVKPPEGTTLAEALGKLDTRRPMSVDEFLSSPAGGGPPPPPPPAPPPWYDGMDLAAMEAAIRADPAKAASVEPAVLERFNNQLLLDLGAPALMRLSPDRLAGTGAFAGAGFAPEVQQWIASQRGGTAAAPGAAAAAAPALRLSSVGEGASSGLSLAPAAPLSLAVPPAGTMGTNGVALNTRPLLPGEDARGRALENYAASRADQRPGYTVAGEPLPAIPRNAGPLPGPTSGPYGHTPGFSAGNYVPTADLAGAPVAGPPQSSIRPLSLAPGQGRVLELTPPENETVPRQAPAEWQAVNASPLPPGATGMPLVTRPAPAAATGARPGVIGENVFGRPTPGEQVGGIRLTQPLNARPAAAPAAPAGAQPLRTLTLADVRSAGVLRPTLDRALTPFGSGPGQRLSRPLGGQALRQPGGIRPLSMQSYNALNPTDRRSLGGLVNALGGRQEDYFADIARRNGQRLG